MKRFCLLVLIFFPVIAFASNYKVSVTRKDSNLYKVTGKDIYIVTRYCYEYVYYEDSILHAEGSYGSKLLFLDEGEECDVDGVYGAANISSGTYKVTVSEEGDNWYEVFGEDIFIKTQLCLNLALSEEAVLDISYGGHGTIYFLDSNDQCAVEGVFEKLRL